MTKPMPWSRRSALLAAHPDTLIRVWTLQSPAMLDDARVRGWISGDHAFGEDSYERDEVLTGTGFWRAYRWMQAAMAARLLDYSGEPPVWAWLKRPCARRMKATVRLTALVPRKRLLLSDFSMWHSVLMGQPCSLSEAEADAAQPVPGFAHSPTWNRIFDLRPRTADAAYWCSQPTQVQACVDRIYLSEIIAQRAFDDAVSADD